MPAAARVSDVTGHGPPLNPGPGSPDVRIGGLQAWRAVPSGAAGAVEAVSSTMQQFMATPVMTPADAASQLAGISRNLTELGAKGATVGATGAPGAAASSVTTLNTTNTSLSSAWTTASAVPGGLPAANAAYTEGVKAAAATAASAVMASLAGVADMHNCPVPTPVPPHGPGFVTKGSTTVRINGLPATRQGDKVLETCGGSDPIAVGLPTVNIGDASGSGAPGGTGAAPGDSAASSDEQAREYREAASQAPPAQVSSPGAAQLGPLAPAAPPEQPAPRAPSETAGDGTWIGILLRDFDGSPLPNQPFQATLSGRQMLRGVTDARGYARFDGIRPGRGDVVFELIPQDETPVDAMPQGAPLEPQDAAAAAAPRPATMQASAAPKTPPSRRERGSSAR